MYTVLFKMTKGNPIEYNMPIPFHMRIYRQDLKRGTAEQSYEHIWGPTAHVIQSDCMLEIWASATRYFIRGRSWEDDDKIESCIPSTVRDVLETILFGIPNVHSRIVL